MKNVFIVIIKDLCHFIMDYCIKLLSLVFRFFPIDSNKIVFCCYMGKGYGDNLKPICDELINKENYDFDIMWVLNKKNYNKEMPKGVRKVKYKSLKYLYELSTSKIWLDNSRKEFVPFKRKNQYYIQTWHAGLCLKKVEKDAEAVLPKFYIRRAISDSKNADLFISNSLWETRLYNDSFWYNGKILEEGIPRNDILINSKLHPKIKSNIYKKFNIDLNKKILLYAPTFRSDFSLSAYNLDFNEFLNHLNKSSKEEWVLLLKLHPNISEKSHRLNIPKDSVDVSNYGDLYELMISSDMLITDYSSLMFDYGYLNKPLFLYASDIGDYLKDRGFYFNYYKLPFPITTNTKELVSAYNKYDQDLYRKKLKEFYNSVGLKETGHSAKKISDIIVEVCKDEKK